MLSYFFSIQASKGFTKTNNDFYGYIFQQYVMIVVSMEDAVDQIFAVVTQDIVAQHAMKVC